MANVEVSIWINAPLERVYAIAKDSPSFPDFMHDVKSVTRIESDGKRVVSDWVGVIPNFLVKVRWRQEDLWDDDAHTCHFKQLKGDYDFMEGVWTFAEERGGTQFSTNLDYEYNVPTLGPLLKKVIHGIVIKNLESINKAIKEKSEATPAG